MVKAGGHGFLSRIRLTLNIGFNKNDSSRRSGGMVDAEDSKSSGGNPLRVRVSPPVPHKNKGSRSTRSRTLFYAQFPVISPTWNGYGILPSCHSPRNDRSSYCPGVFEPTLRPDACTPRKNAGRVGSGGRRRPGNASRSGPRVRSRRFRGGPGRWGRFASGHRSRGCGMRR